MPRPLLAAAVLFALAAVGSAQKPTPKPADKVKAPAVKEIMQKAHAKTGVLNKLDQAAKGGRWDDAKPLADELVVLGDDLVKASAPKKGTAKSWAENTKEYADETKAYAAAVGKKDAAGAKAAHGAITELCRTCHGAHK